MTAHKVINCWSFKECLFFPPNDIQQLRVSKILTDFFLITITKNVAILDTRVSRNGVLKCYIF